MLLRVVSRIESGTVPGTVGIVEVVPVLQCMKSPPKEGIFGEQLTVQRTRSTSTSSTGVEYCSVLFFYYQVPLKGYHVFL